MALNIKDPETDRLARELSGVTGESITVAVRMAIQERLVRERRRVPSDDAEARLLALVRRGRSRPRLHDRSEDEILGYDEHGSPA